MGGLRRKYRKHQAGYEIEANRNKSAKSGEELGAAAKAAQRESIEISRRLA